jgi:hypothetical protein
LTQINPTDSSQRIGLVGRFFHHKTWVEGCFSLIFAALIENKVVVQGAGQRDATR